MNKTIQSQLAELLLNKGMREVNSKTKKYLVFYDPQQDKFYLLGKAGALRTNGRPTIEGSISQTHLVNTLLREARS